MVFHSWQKSVLIHHNNNNNNNKKKKKKKTHERTFVYVHGSFRKELGDKYLKYGFNHMCMLAGLKMHSKCLY